MEANEEILKRFEYTPGKEGNQEPDGLSSIRTEIQAAAGAVLSYTRPSREQALAITQLEQAYMWAVAAYVRKK